MRDGLGWVGFDIILMCHIHNGNVMQIEMENRLKSCKLTFSTTSKLCFCYSLGSVPKLQFPVSRAKQRMKKIKKETANSECHAVYKT